MLAKLNFIDKPILKIIILKSRTTTPSLAFSVAPNKLKEILVRKKSLTTPSGNNQLIKFPINPPTAAPKKRPIRIREIFLLVIDQYFEELVDSSFLLFFINQSIMLQTIYASEIGSRI